MFCVLLPALSLKKFWTNIPLSISLSEWGDRSSFKNWLKNAEHLNLDFLDLCIFWISDLGSWDLDFEFRFLDCRFWILDLGYCTALAHPQFLLVWWTNFGLQTPSSHQISSNNTSTTYFWKVSTQPTKRNTSFKPLYGLKWFPTSIWIPKFIEGLAISIPDPLDQTHYFSRNNNQHLNISCRQTNSNNTSTTKFWKVSTQPATRNTNFKPLYGQKWFPTSIWNQKFIEGLAISIPDPLDQTH